MSLKETQRRGKQGMSGRRQEEHFNTYMDESKPTNLSNTFSLISTGFDSGLQLEFIFLLYMQLCAENGIKFAGSSCFKINRNVGLTSPGKIIQPK